MTEGGDRVRNGGLVIALITWRCCIRSTKMAWGLSRRGHRVILLTRQILVSAEPFAEIYRYTDRRSFARILKKRVRADVYQASNTPYRHIEWALDLLPTVILDVHDLVSVATLGNITLPAERKCLRRVSGHIFPSESYVREAERYYALGNKPRTVVYSAVPSHLYPRERLARKGGLVYAGGLAVRGETDVRKSFNDLFPLWERLHRAGVPVTLFPSLDLDYGYPVEKSLDYLELLPELTRYDWGLYAAPVVHPQWMASMPNKLFEYLACGVPAVVLNAAEPGAFVRRHGTGIEVRRLEEVHDALALVDYAALCRHMQDVRWEFTMEQEAAKLERFYEHFL